MQLSFKSLADDLLSDAARDCIDIALQIMVSPENNNTLFLFISEFLLNNLT